MTIFQKIIDREISADIVCEDELSLAFKDIQPCSNPHFRLPKPLKYSQVHAEDASILGHLLVVCVR